MIKILLAFALFIFFFTACKKDSSVTPDQASLDDAGFNRYEAHFLDELWKLNPDWATSVGYHKYDSLLLVPDKKTRENCSPLAKCNRTRWANMFRLLSWKPIKWIMPLCKIRCNTCNGKFRH